MVEEFKKHLESLSAANTGDEKEKILLEITSLLGVDASRPLYADIVKSSNLIQMLAQAMTENTQWAKRTPSFIPNIPLYVYFDAQWDIPRDQTLALVESVKAYLKLFPGGSYVRVLRSVVRPFSNKKLFLEDEEFMNVVKKAIFSKNEKSSSSALLVLLTATDQCPEWQLKLLKSSQLIYDILDLEGREEVWSLLGNLVQHPDAKTELPAKVLEKARVEKFPSCTDVFAILCSENDAASLNMSAEYLMPRVRELKLLLEKRYAVGGYLRFNLVELILPFVNLSIADANKESLGQYVIEPLLQVVAITRDKPLISNIEFCLDRAQQEATKALWNLAFSKPNLNIIKELNGIAILEAARNQIQDVTSQKNITGILHMFSNPEENAPPGKASSRGHIMISYNWGHQALVLKLAKSLKQLGYSIWLDVEQMEGSTLGAMAAAVEGAELVLMCVSQKYKDSPNCRLEGEYVSSRKAEFIPLMMQDNFKPDGWLGILLGSQLYYLFNDDRDWDTKMNTLAKAIGNRGKGERTSIPPKIPTTPVEKRKTVKEWNEKDILAWMKEEGIEKHKQFSHR